MDIQEFAERVEDGTETSGTRQNIGGLAIDVAGPFLLKKKEGCL